MVLLDWKQIKTCIFRKSETNSDNVRGHAIVYKTALPFIHDGRRLQNIMSAVLNIYMYLCFSHSFSWFSLVNIFPTSSLYLAIIGMKPSLFN